MKYPTEAQYRRLYDIFSVNVGQWATNRIKNSIITLLISRFLMVVRINPIWILFIVDLYLYPKKKRKKQDKRTSHNSGTPTHSITWTSNTVAPQTYYVHISLQFLFYESDKRFLHPEWQKLPLGISLMSASNTEHVQNSGATGWQENHPSSRNIRNMQDVKNK